MNNNGSTDTCAFDSLIETARSTKNTEQRQLSLIRANGVAASFSQRAHILLLLGESDHLIGDARKTIDRLAETVRTAMLNDRSASFDELIPLIGELQGATVHVAQWLLIQCGEKLNQLNGPPDHGQLTREQWTLVAKTVTNTVSKKYALARAERANPSHAPLPA